MNILNKTDLELEEKLLYLIKENNVERYGEVLPGEMVERFLAFTPKARQYIIDYYSVLTPLGNKMNFIYKTGFEHKFFYVSGTDTMIAMLLLGFKINGNREANVKKNDIYNLQQESLNHEWPDNKSFFSFNGLSSKDINITWQDELLKNKKV